MRSPRRIPLVTSQLAPQAPAETFNPSAHADLWASYEAMNDRANVEYRRRAEDMRVAEAHARRRLVLVEAGT